MKLSKKQIVEELKLEILDLELKPGDIISEAILTQRYNISRTPIRDILKQLSVEGYIDISPKRATKISFIDLKSVKQIIYLRSTLERQILQDICGKLTDVDMDKLNTILTKQQVAIEEFNGKDFFKLDDEFHKELFIIADKLFIWELIQKLNVHYIRYRKLHMQETNKLNRLLEEHITLSKYLAQGSRDKIELLTKKHISDDVNSTYFKEHFNEYILDL